MMHIPTTSARQWQAIGWPEDREATQVTGVLYTAHPETAAEDEALVEACATSPGAGEVEAVRLSVAFPSGELRARSGGLPAGDGAPEGAWLAELIHLGAEHQEREGRPVELDFTAGPRGVVVQRVRPMSCFSFAGVESEWTTANFREGGVSSSECSPFMSSLYHQVFQRSMSAYLCGLRLVPRDRPVRWIRTFFSRPYWNFGEVKRAVGQLPGFVERNFDTDLGISPSYAGDGRTTPMTLRGAVRAIPVLLALQRSYGKVLRQVRSHVRDFSRRKAPFDLEADILPMLSPPDFLRTFRRLFDELYLPTEALYFTTVYNMSNAKLELSLSLARANRAAGGGVDYTRLVGALGDVSHLRPMRELHGLLRQAREPSGEVPESTLREFARRWAHRGARELDLRVPRWGEDLEQVRRVAAQARASSAPELDTEEQAERQRAELGAERRRVMAALALPHRLLFSHRLARVRSYVWWREEMRDHSIRVYLIVRRWTLEAGQRLAAEGRLEKAEDVWYLRLDALLGALEGSLSREDSLRLAREGYRRSRAFRHFDAPGELGAPYPLNADRAPAMVPHLLRGTASSPGATRGRARVARVLAEAMELKPGEVLVACFSDPGWTPLFERACAVVTERGGLLSHAAVIAREYGIPAVLGVKGATEHIRTGDMVSVDGATGTVRLEVDPRSEAGERACC